MENPTGANYAIFTSTLSSEKPGQKCKGYFKVVAKLKDRVSVCHEQAGGLQTCCSWTASSPSSTGSRQAGGLP